MFAAIRDRIKPSNYLYFGLSVKCLGENSRVSEINIDLGQCVSYHTVEAPEPDLTTNIAQRDYYIPDGNIQQPWMFTGSSWKNCDENNETLTGSLNVVEGICYQNKSMEPKDRKGEHFTAVSDTKKTSKRVLHLTDVVLEPS